MDKKELINEINSLLSSEDVKTDIPDYYNDKLNILFSDNNLLNFCKLVLTPKFLNNLNYQQLREIIETLNITTNKLNDVVKNIDIDIFLQDGYKLDLQGLTNEFNKLNLKKEYPNIDLSILCNYYAKPPKYIYPYYNENLKIYTNPIVVRKYVIAIIQMVFNEMDLLIAYTGSEGSGKSTLATQHMLLVHQILKNSGIKNYDYKIKKMMFSSLANLRNAEDETFTDTFRQLTLDEGNELHRQNWKEEEVQTFFQRLRRERYNRRIKSICIPVLGELMTNIIMSRVNFIFEVSSKSVSKLGILEKGQCNFYIIPRGKKIYSYKHKKDLTRDGIKSTLYEVLKDKSYLKGLPHSLIINEFKFNGVNGFRKEEYIKVLKESNKSFSVKEGLKLNNTTLYMLYIAKLKLKTLGITSKDPRYSSISKFIQNIRNYFIDNPRAKKIEEEKFKQKYDVF